MRKIHRRNLTIRIGKDERKKLEACAEKSGVSLTRYIRKVALGELPQSNTHLNGRSISQKEFVDLYKKLSKIGANINQIAKRLNVESARKKVNGNDGLDLANLPVKKIKALIKIYDITNGTLSKLRDLIREVV